METKIKKTKTSFNPISNEKFSMKQRSNPYNQTTENKKTDHNSYSFIVPWQQQAHIVQ
ncbi:hypothetical protein [Carboxylicivirga sp. N1Y90]|uniref:hypothetical protein n=1 Tax=Carboxylicivirga fragile TaxID=3417571 RepID=UPI003D329494|nr:hypothetical protein [Marinilabiliaceae bacterium N1Y90]